MITHKKSKEQVEQIADYLRDSGIESSKVQTLAYDIFSIFKPIRKQQVTKQGIKMLKHAANHVIETGENQFRKSELTLTDFGQSAYGNFQSLRYHGLITHVRDENDKPIKGHWLITRRGWEFLRGKREVNKFVMVQDGHIRDDLPRGPMLNIVEVYKGAEEVNTNFEYFDDAGNMVGLRPYVQGKPEQRILL